MSQLAVLLAVMGAVLVFLVWTTAEQIREYRQSGATHVWGIRTEGAKAKTLIMLRVGVYAALFLVALNMALLGR